MKQITWRCKNNMFIYSPNDYFMRELKNCFVKQKKKMQQPLRQSQNRREPMTINGLSRRTIPWKGQDVNSEGLRTIKRFRSETKYNWKGELY